MVTASALRSVPSGNDESVGTVAALRSRGWSDRAIRAQLAARRWQRIGRAIVLHNGEPSRSERAAVALANHGPRSVLTSFTAAEQYGLTGWERDKIHVLVPAGARVTAVEGARTHYTGDWLAVASHPIRPLHRLAPALVVAAAGFSAARPACGILAAGVQQRLVRASDLRSALDRAPRTRHRQILIHAVDDIAQGAHALSEIDFARLCRRHELPRPGRQGVRVEPNGRRPYLDAEWLRPDGRRVTVEVDGAIHLAVTTWVTDQLRQNELVIGGDLLLRYPSVIVRSEEPIVADQLRRALLLR